MIYNVPVAFNQGSRTVRDAAVCVSSIVQAILILLVSNEMSYRLPVANVVKGSNLCRSYGYNVESQNGKLSRFNFSTMPVLSVEVQRSSVLVIAHVLVSWE